MPRQEGAQEGHFRQRTEQEPSSRCRKMLTSAANKEPFIIWASFPSCQFLCKTFTHFSVFKTYNPKPSFLKPDPQFSSSNTLFPAPSLHLRPFCSLSCLSLPWSHTPAHRLLLTPPHGGLPPNPRQDPSGYRSPIILGEAPPLPNFHKPPSAIYS